MTKEQFIKDLEVIKWNLEHKEQATALQVVDIMLKRYGHGVSLPDIVDPGSQHICEGCE